MTEAEKVIGIYEELLSWKRELVEDLAARLSATCEYKLSLIYYINIYYGLLDKCDSDI
jgi:hypothetical protein